MTRQSSILSDAGFDKRRDRLTPNRRSYSVDQCHAAIGGGDGTPPNLMTLTPSYTQVKRVRSELIWSLHTFPSHAQATGAAVRPEL